jgi:hypothetical protein
MERLNLEIAPDVVAFVEGCLEGLGMADPVPTLIYGKFPDERANNFRIALVERAELSTEPSAKGAVYFVERLNELFVQDKHRPEVENTVMRLVEDCVVFEPHLTSRSRPTPSARP